MLRTLIPYLFLLTAYVVQAQQEYYAPSNGVNIHFTVIGKGKPILIINGGPGFSSEGFLPLAKQISALGYQTIIYDQRGTGKSTLPETNSTNITMDLMNEDIEAIRKYLKIEKWVVLGHSFGGIMANYYASHYATTIKGMIHSSSGGIDLALLGMAQQSLNKRLSQTERDSLDLYRASAYAGDEEARKTYYKIFARAYVYHKQYAPIIAERLLQGNMQLNALVWQNLQLIEFDCKPTLKYFVPQVLIIQGKEDMIPVSLSEKEHEVFPNSTLVLLDECGHYGWLDQKEKYFKAIKEFMENI